MSDYITIQEAAALLGVSESMLQKRCKSGSLPCSRVGKQYRVTRRDLEAWVKFTPSIKVVDDKVSPAEVQALFDTIDRWHAFMKMKDLSPTTIASYRACLLAFIKKVEIGGTGVVTPANLFQRQVLVRGFERMVAKSASHKINTINALLSFGRFLVFEEVLQTDALNVLKGFRPARNPDPRRTFLRAVDIPKFFHAVAMRTEDAIENVTVAAIMGLMVYAGCRVSEAVNVRYGDVQLDDRMVTIHHGKGRKDRLLGIRRELKELLEQYMKIRPKVEEKLGALKRSAEDAFFLRTDGGQWSKDHLAWRLRHISKLIGTSISAHGLRRTFATIEAAKGRSMNFLRIALGHKHLTTTQSYLRHSESEVARDMVDW